MKALQDKIKKLSQDNDNLKKNLMEATQLLEKVSKLIY